MEGHTLRASQILEHLDNHTQVDRLHTIQVGAQWATAAGSHEFFADSFELPEEACGQWQGDLSHGFAHYVEGKQHLEKLYAPRPSWVQGDILLDFEAVVVVQLLELRVFADLAGVVVIVAVVLLQQHCRRGFAELFQSAVEKGQKVHVVAAAMHWLRLHLCVPPFQPMACEAAEQWCRFVVSGYWVELTREMDVLPAKHTSLDVCLGRRYRLFVAPSNQVEQSSFWVY